MGFETGLSAGLIWALAGLALCALELVAPGAFLVWIGLAALAVGALHLVFAPGLALSSVAFAALAVVFALLGRKVYGGRETPEGGAVLNDRARALIGRAAALDMAIGPEPGRVRFDDAQWRVQGPELPAGARVRVTGVAADGLTLLVESV